MAELSAIAPGKPRQGFAHQVTAKWMTSPRLQLPSKAVVSPDLSFCVQFGSGAVRHLCSSLRSLRPSHDPPMTAWEQQPLTQLNYHQKRLVAKSLQLKQKKG